jgi:CheY-like chemotaxis protein
MLEAAREKGCKGLVTSQGAAALALARDHMPDALTLDIVLPDMDGWRVLDRLKHDLSTRHIPVCVVSAEDARERAFDAGVRAFIAKPIPSKEALDAGLEHILAGIRRQEKRVVAIGKNAEAIDPIIAAIAGDDLIVTPATPGTMLATIAAQDPDCVVLDAHGGVDIGRIARAQEMRPGLGRLPVLVWGRSPQGGDAQWARSSHPLTLRHVHSRERLVDLVAFFAHRRVTRLPEAQLAVLEELHQSDSPVDGRKVLIVDDDIRNIYALRSVLEEHDMAVQSASNGRDALRIIAGASPIDIVLMDIMMPELDGYETMHRIRGNPRFERLPILALTAKAMKGDREKCLDAGASDYIAKPVNTEQLLSLMRVWLHR